MAWRVPCLVEELICCFATGSRVFKKIFGPEMPWQQHKELPELVGQDAVLAARNEGTQLGNVLQLSSLHRTTFFFPHLFSFPWFPSQLAWTAGPGLLWDVGEEGAAVQSISGGDVWGACSFASELQAWKFQAV